MSEKPLSGFKVLVVEDDYFIAEEAHDVLRDAGAEVLGPAASIETARNLLADTRPDYALLDINLGSGPDFTLARSMTAIGVPVVLVTGYDRSVIPSDLTCLPCLQKPASAQKLVQTVLELRR